jgi:hypothetical protein
MTDGFDLAPEGREPEGRDSGAASGREADALRAALTARASELDFAPLDPAELALRARVIEGASGVGGGSAGSGPSESGPSESGARGGAAHDELAGRRRRPLVLAVAAMVVLVLAVPLGMQVLLRMGSATATSASRAEPAPAAAAPAGGESGQFGGAASGPAADGAEDAGVKASASLPPLAVGYRYESFLDVVLQVPDSWGYAVAVQSDWCASDGARYAKPTGPFVALDPMEQAVAAILCPGDVPDAMQSQHVEWVRATASTVDAERTANGWVYTSRVVGSALVTYVHRPGVDAGVLASAVQVAVDHNGCPVAAPGGARRGPVTLPGTPTSGVLCEYLDQPEVVGPSLVTSRPLDAAAASALSARIEAGTVVAGKLPDAGCLATPDATPAVVARFAAGGVVKEIWLSGGCGVPTFDDGALVRQATRPACTGIYTPPLARGSWNATVAAVCKA